MPEFIFPASPLRVAVAGDWHANTDYARRAILHASKRGADVLVHVGDFGYLFTPAYLNTLTATLERCDMTLLFVDGNHEDFDFLLAQPLNDDGVRPLSSRIAHLPRGFSWTWGSEKWLALGGAHSVDRQWRNAGSEWWFQETLKQSDVEKASAVGKVDHLVCHDVPWKAELPGVSREGGLRMGIPAVDLDASEVNRKMVQEVVDATQPSQVWCGHYHTRVDLAAGPDTKVSVLHCDANEFNWNMVFWDVQL